MFDQDCYPAPNEADLSSVYKLRKVIGTGGCGTVYLGRRRSDGEKVVIKLVQQRHAGYNEYLTADNVNRVQIPDEIIFMQKAKSVKGVINFVEWFSDERKKIVAIVMEYKSNATELFEYLEKYTCEETEAREIFVQLVKTLIELKHLGIAHLDIKTENILIYYKHNELRIKLIDFGGARFIADNPMDSFKGTKEFAAPEYVAQGQFHTESYDVWTLGLLLNEMLLVEKSFTQEELRNYVELILVERDDLQVSESCKDLIRQCTRRNPEERPTLECILEHDFVKKRQ